MERNDLLPVAKVQMAGFAPGCTFREEHQFKQIFIVIKGSEYNGVLAVSAESLECWECLQSYPTLSQFLKRFIDLPRITRFLPFFFLKKPLPF